MRLLLTGLPAHIGFIGFDDPAQLFPQWTLTHAVADAVSHEPRALVRDFQRAMELMGTHPFFRGRIEMECPKPLIEWNVAVLKDRSDCHAELLAARSALDDLTPTFAGRQTVNLAEHSAMRAYRTIRPAQHFQILAR